MGCQRDLTPRPLYSSARADCPTQTPLVVVCEGEKKADLATPILFQGAVGTTSMGGAKAAAQSDWSPLAGCDVVIWADHDEPGAAYG